MQIVFRKKSISEWSVLFILFMPFVMSFLMDFIGLPNFLKYSIDIAWLCSLVIMLNRNQQVVDTGVRKLLLCVSIFFGVSLIGFLLNYQSALYYLWGIRNNARFFVYFFACVFFVRLDSVEHYLAFFDKVYFINFPIVLFQFFIMGKKQDYLGGIFGIDKGCNAYTNILLIIVIAKSLLYCLANREKMVNCLIKCAIAILIAAFSELKAFYVEFIVIVAMAVLLTKSSYRKIWIIIGSMFGVMLGVQLLGMIFPIFSDWFTFKKIMEIISNNKGYTASNDMNRLTAISIAMERFLPAWYQKLFGLGLGNCDYAAYNFLTTPFYKAYSGLNYMWFSSAFLVLETGLVGMVLYIFFFIRIFLSAWKMGKADDQNKIYCQMSMICSVMCGFLFVLNSSLRTEAAFMMFFVLALPFVRRNKMAEEAVVSKDKVTEMVQ